MQTPARFYLCQIAFTERGHLNGADCLQRSRLICISSAFFCLRISSLPHQGGLLCFILKCTAFPNCNFSDVNDESVIHAVKLLYPKLEHQLLLAKQVALIEPLKDIAAHEEDTSFFAPEYAYILDNSEPLMSEFKRQPAKLERLYGNYHSIILQCTTPYLVLKVTPLRCQKVKSVAFKD